MANNYSETIHSNSSDYDENTSSSNYVTYGPNSFPSLEREKLQHYQLEENLNLKNFKAKH